MKTVDEELGIVDAMERRLTLSELVYDIYEDKRNSRLEIEPTSFLKNGNFSDICQIINSKIEILNQPDMKLYYGKSRMGFENSHLSSEIKNFNLKNLSVEEVLKSSQEIISDEKISVIKMQKQINALEENSDSFDTENNIKFLNNFDKMYKIPYVINDNLNFLNSMVSNLQHQLETLKNIKLNFSDPIKSVLALSSRRNIILNLHSSLETIKESYFISSQVKILDTANVDDYNRLLSEFNERQRYIMSPQVRKYLQSIWIKSLNQYQKFLLENITRDIKKFIIKNDQSLLEAIEKFCIVLKKVEGLDTFKSRLDQIFSQDLEDWNIFNRQDADFIDEVEIFVQHLNYISICLSNFDKISKLLSKYSIDILDKKKIFFEYCTIFLSDLLKTKVSNNINLESCISMLHIFEIKFAALLQVSGFDNDHFLDIINDSAKLKQSKFISFLEMFSEKLDFEVKSDTFSSVLLPSHIQLKLNQIIQSNDKTEIFENYVELRKVKYVISTNFQYFVEIISSLISVQSYFSHEKISDSIIIILNKYIDSLKLFMNKNKMWGRPSQLLVLSTSLNFLNSLMTYITSFIDTNDIRKKTALSEASQFFMNGFKTYETLSITKFNSLLNTVALSCDFTPPVPSQSMIKTVDVIKKIIKAIKTILVEESNYKQYIVQILLNFTNIFRLRIKEGYHELSEESKSAIIDDLKYLIKEVDSVINDMHIFSSEKVIDSFIKLINELN